jgi:hypothetical protein
MRDQALARERRSHSSEPMRPRRASPDGSSERSSTRRPKYRASGSRTTSAGDLAQDCGRTMAFARASPRSEGQNGPTAGEIGAPRLGCSGIAFIRAHLLSHKSRWNRWRLNARHAAAKSGGGPLRGVEAGPATPLPPPCSLHASFSCRSFARELLERARCRSSIRTPRCLHLSPLSLEAKTAYRRIPQQLQRCTRYTRCAVPARPARELRQVGDQRPGARNWPY